LGEHEQLCLNALNRRGAAAAKTQASENARCLKGAVAGRLPGSAEECIDGDQKGKVGRAALKTLGKEADKCYATFPAFGRTEGSTVGHVASAADIELLHDLFGPDLDSAILTDESGAKCQRAMLKI
jgi:hypothetical protein